MSVGPTGPTLAESLESINIQIVNIRQNYEEKLATLDGETQYELANVLRRIDGELTGITDDLEDLL